MIRITGWILGFGITLIVLGSIFGWFSDTAQTAQKEFGTSSLLKKYESFKNLSAAIDKKKADIMIYQEQLKDENDPTEKNMLKAELRGIVSMHNTLVAQYNSDMAKFNYRFTNVGDLPASNLTPLPREYREYITSLNNKP